MASTSSITGIPGITNAGTTSTGQTGGFSLSSSSAFLQYNSAAIQPSLNPVNTTLNPYGVNRQPWIFATFNQLLGAGALIGPSSSNSGSTATASNITGAALGLANPTSGAVIWAANPKSVSWTINQRGSETKNKSGTVLHIWHDRNRGTDYDDPKINITFQSGSVVPVNPNSAMAAPGNGPQQAPTTAAPGLNNFYGFLQLVDQAKTIAVSNGTGGEANLIHILYRSAIFPSLVLTGFFDPQAVIQFTDSADNPFQVNSWTANFTIYSTIPQINNFTALNQSFINDGLAYYQAGYG